MTLVKMTLFGKKQIGLWDLETLFMIQCHRHDLLSMPHTCTYAQDFFREILDKIIENFTQFEMFTNLGVNKTTWKCKQESRKTEDLDLYKTTGITLGTWYYVRKLLNSRSVFHG